MGGILDDLIGGPKGPSAADLKAAEEKEQQKALAGTRNDARRSAARRGSGTLLNTGIVIPGVNNTGGS